MYYSSDGKALKKFNTRDAKGIELVVKTGIDVALISGEDSAIVEATRSKLGLRHCFFGVENKKALLENLCRELKISLDSVAYVGNDINDLDCLQSAGFSAAPADAATAILKVVDYISSARGGEGAIREICDLIAYRMKPFNESLSL